MGGDWDVNVVVVFLPGGNNALDSLIVVLRDFTPAERHRVWMASPAIEGPIGREIISVIKSKPMWAQEAVVTQDQKEWQRCTLARLEGNAMLGKCGYD